MPDLNATITKISASFFTHNDNKDHDTSVSVLVQNRISVFLSQDLARLDNFAGNDEFGDNPPSTNTFDLTLASENIKLGELSLPTQRPTSARQMWGTHNGWFRVECSSHPLLRKRVGHPCSLSRVKTGRITAL